MIWIMIALGGAIGALLRYSVSSFVYTWLGRGFPYGTLSVNVLGSFCIGLLLVYFTQRGSLQSATAKGLMIGVLGAFTTFSSFSLDTLQLIEQQAWGIAILNVILNVALCLGAVTLGVLLARLF